MDDRVAAAISHWAPRFTTNGVTAPDFERITAEVGDWAGWCAAWSAVAADHERLGRDALAAGCELSAGAHLSRAAVYYHFAKFLFVDDMEQLRAAHRAAVRCLTDALPFLSPPGRRIEIPFEGAHITGVLRLPPGGGPHPVVAMIPGLDSAKEEFGSTEQLFLDRGLATFSVDGPGQGEAEYDLPIRGDWEVPGPPSWTGSAPSRGWTPAGSPSGGSASAATTHRGSPAVTSGCGRASRWPALRLRRNLGRLPGLTRAAFRVRSASASDTAARGVASTLSLAGRAGAIRCPLLAVMGRATASFPGSTRSAWWPRPAARRNCCSWRRATTAARTSRPSTGTRPPTGSRPSYAPPPHASH